MHENCFKAFCLKSFMKYRLQDTLILKTEQYILVIKRLLPSISYDYQAADQTSIYYKV